ncbi:MAG: glycoside hydrolase family 97 C-terminal domain-containing protein, partial [Phycisphaerales bacterium]
TVPFTRMLAGPLDFHQGSFRTVPVAEFKPRNQAPLIMGTPCRTLASYVVFQNHLPMVADYPSAYRGHPALPILADIPATWDETKFIDGAVGEFVVIARRQDEDWWVGAMTDCNERRIRLPLSFLEEGRFRADLYRDDVSAAYGLCHEAKEVEADDVIQATLAPAGGVLIRLTPVEASPAEARLRGVAFHCLTCAVAALCSVSQGMRQPSHLV